MDHENRNNGFLIQDNKLYDTTIQSFELKKTIEGDIILYSMKPLYYKRLYLFEALLSIYDKEKVFRILNFNKHLSNERKKDNLDKKLHYISNMTVVYNYPVMYLTKRKFNLYKLCKALEKKLD